MNMKLTRGINAGSELDVTGLIRANFTLNTKKKDIETPLWKNEWFHAGFETFHLTKNLNYILLSISARWHSLVNV